MPILGDGFCVGLVAVVEDALFVDVRQRVEMRVRDAVIVDAIRSEPMPCIVTSYGFGLSTAFTVSASAASDTETPSFTSAAA